MRVSNLTSPRTGNKVANQFVINDEENNTEYFQSYNTLIAKKTGVYYTISSNYNYSRTTSKYFKQWLQDEWGWTNAGVDELKKWLGRDPKNGAQLFTDRANVTYVEEL